MRSVELLVFAAILAWCNLHLFAGEFPKVTAFLPDLVAAGEWWRILTHAFAHVSWYHLVLDGAGFLILYQSLPMENRAGRLAIFASAVAGSLIAVALMDARVAFTGFCGLSGAAHGLMAVTLLAGMRSENSHERRLNIIIAAGFAAKCIMEAITGGAMLASLHFGDIGTPIGICHGGGALGGLFAGLICPRVSKNCQG